MLWTITRPALAAAAVAVLAAAIAATWPGTIDQTSFVVDDTALTVS